MHFSLSGSDARAAPNERQPGVCRWWCTTLHHAECTCTIGRPRRENDACLSARSSANDARVSTGVKCVFSHGVVISSELFRRRLIGNVDKRPFRFHAYRISRLIRTHVTPRSFPPATFLSPFEISIFRSVSPGAQSLRRVNIPTTCWIIRDERLVCSLFRVSFPFRIFLFCLS